MSILPNDQEQQNETPPTQKKKLTKILIITNILAVVIIVVGFGTMGIVHVSNTNPSFCGSCHVMEKNVNSYLTGHTLDNVHYQAGVECKDCHEYPIPEEIAAGFTYLTGSYQVNTDGELLKRTFSDEMCLECHINIEYLAAQTDFLPKNPHDNHKSPLACSECHLSHGEQIDFCSECHDNKGQRMTGEEIEDRGVIGEEFFP